MSKTENLIQTFNTKLPLIEFSTTSKNMRNKFTKEEDELLLQLAQKYQEKQWQKISEYFINKNYIQCFSRYKRIHPDIRHGTWTKKEDETILKYHQIYGNKWAKIASEMKTRNGKQIRDRFINMLDPSRNTKNFTLDEDKEIIKLFLSFGPKWSKISGIMKSGRNPDMIKNRFYSHLRDKLPPKFKVEYHNSPSLLNSSTQISSQDISKNISEELPESMNQIDSYCMNYDFPINNSLFNEKELEKIDCKIEKEDGIQNIYKNIREDFPENMNQNNNNLNFELPIYKSLFNLKEIAKIEDKVEKEEGFDYWDNLFFFNQSGNLEL